MTDVTAPERIWLNTAGSYADAYEANIGTETGVTWCDIPQDDDDQEYIRADLGSFYQEKDIDAMQDRIEALEAENARLREALVRIDDASNHYCMTPTYSESVLRYAHKSTRNLARAALEGGE